MWKKASRMFNDFRSYLNYVEENGKLLKVKREVNPRFEIAAGIRKISNSDGPALLFENIRGFPGWRIAGGLFGTQKLTALSLGLPMDADEESITKRYLECDQKRVAPKLVSTGPVKEVILKGEEVDLTKLPVPIFSELDSGSYLTAGVEIGRDHRTGVQNTSIHRRQIIAKSRTSILARGMQHLGKMIAAAEADGQGLHIATVIGAPPELMIASNMLAPEGVDEAYIAGALRGAPLEVVKCETIDVEVPANAEIVIEGVIIPHERFLDGPFGEFPGNYITMIGQAQTEVPVIEVTAITMRENPIFHVMLTGMPMTENHYLKKWAIAASAYRAIAGSADIKAINCTPGGAAGYHLVVAINKKDDSEPKTIIDALANKRHGPKYAVIVDDDINVYDPFDVEWALATRMKAANDIVITQAVPPIPSKLFIDATAPLKDKKWYQKARVPGVDKVDYV
jgi:2,5-furandicarboxylate decarboxylase 1